MSFASLLRMLVLAAVWGSSFLFMRVAVPVLGAVPTAFTRVLLAALGLALAVAALRIARDFQGKLGATLALGVINSGVPFLMYSFAARVLPAGYSAILNATAPLMGVLVGAAAFGERPTAAKLASVAIGLTGVAVLTQTGPVQASAAVLGGVAACLTATVCYALAGYLTKRWITQRGGLDNRLVAFGSQLGAVLCLLPVVLAQAQASAGAGADASAPTLWVAWSAAGAREWGALLALGLVCTAGAYVLYFRLIADVGPLKALAVTFLIPLFGVLWGALFLGETLSWAHAAGGGLIALALWLVLRPAAP